MGKFLDLLNRKLRTTRQSTYHRPEYNSFMSGPEWRNVEIAEEFAQWLKDGKSMFHYPYFSQIADMWRVFYKSWRAARQYDSASRIATSEYMAMDVFVAFFTTMELLPKGLIGLVLKGFLGETNPTTMQAALAADLEQYAKDLQTVPFYDQQYAARHAALVKAYKETNDKTWGDWFTWKFMSAELWARRLVSMPLHAWFHDESNLVPPTTDILVEMTVENETDAEKAVQVFRDKVAKLTAPVSIVQDEEKHDIIFSETHEFKQDKSNESIVSDKSYTHIYGLLHASRYATFQGEIKALAEEGIHVTHIAGQSQVQVKCEINVDHPRSLQTKLDQLRHVPNAQLLYTYGDQIHPNRQICLFDVPVVHLQPTVAALNRQDAVNVSYIHNF